MMATAEFVVPRSMPITDPLTFSSVDWKRAKRERVGAAVLCSRPAERVALGSCNVRDWILAIAATS